MSNSASDHSDWRISSVETIAHPLRRLLLFGSFGQLTSYLACLAAVLLPVLLFFDPQPRLALVMSLGALCGSIPAVLAVLPARLTVHVTGETAAATVEQHLDWVIRRMGYQRVRADDARRYIPRTNWWARWRESHFLVRQAHDHVVVTGPRTPLHVVRRQTAARLSPR